MKKRVWSNPDLEWAGFEPVAYWFETGKIWALPLTRVYDDAKADEPTSIGSIIELLRDKRLKRESFEPGILVNEFVAIDGSLKIAVKGPSFNLDLLRIILELHAEGIGALEAVFYYFDHDSCRQEPHEMYFFFVVAKNKIIRDRIGFSDYHNSDFDPAIFETHNYRDGIWGNEAHWDEAQARYWYRKFYTDTRTGQLMVLRPDNPQVFLYERAGADAIGAIRVLQPLLSQIKLVLWVLVAISLINLAIHWR